MPPGLQTVEIAGGLGRVLRMKRNHGVMLSALVGLALLATACGSSSSSGSTTTSTQGTTASSTTATTGAGSATDTAAFCKDAATVKSELLVWTGATPGSPSAAAEPVAQTLQTLAAESPAAIKAQVQDLQSTFVQLEKYDTVTDPNTLLQEGPLTTGHVTPDSNALGTYVNAHC